MAVPSFIRLIASIAAPAAMIRPQAVRPVHPLVRP
jgi:hypothetical protein